ncbi:MAG: cytochrome c [Nitrospirae bacterium]|nr:cytochrome c [Nitrospirota bacterium]
MSDAIEAATGWGRAGRFVVLAVLSVGWFGAAGCSRSEPPTVSPTVAAEVPAEHAEGRRLFEAHCARCHGSGGAGTDHGPAFLSKIYEPNHHGDASFLMAARRGVTAHHWRFGDMPPIPGVSDDDVTRIVGYIRWVQRQSGIT